MDCVEVRLIVAMIFNEAFILLMVNFEADFSITKLRELNCLLKKTDSSLFKGYSSNSII